MHKNSENINVYKAYKRAKDKVVHHQLLFCDHIHKRVEKKRRIENKEEVESLSSTMNSVQSSGNTTSLNRKKDSQFEVSKLYYITSKEQSHDGCDRMNSGIIKYRQNLRFMTQKINLK